MNFTLKIWRQKDAKSQGAFETYEVKNISADTSFLEMLDILNNDLVHAGKEPVAFDHDCREGICGMCSLHINGRAHGPGKAATTCQIYMRKFKDGEALRHDDKFAYAAVWEYKGIDNVPEMTIEPLDYEFVHRAQRNYKD